MANDDIPFPLLAGQYFAASENGVKKFFKVVGQPTMYDLTYPYEIGPGLEIPDQTINLGTGSGAITVFKADYLKEWVTWIDNEYLTVKWKINSTDMNALNSFPEPLTKNIAQYGNINFPLFLYHNASGNVNFTLGNASLTKVISGVLHIIMYDYKTEPAQGMPQQYTDIEYRRLV